MNNDHRTKKTALGSDRTAILILGLVVIISILTTGCAIRRPAGFFYDGIPYPPAEPMAEDIYHIPTGIKMPLYRVMDMISPSRAVFIGEMHTNIHAHRVELTIIKELQRRFPGQVAIGMEMFREDQQEALDRLSRGELTDKDFLKESKWYQNWGSDYDYYRDILSFARENRIDVIALNPSRKDQMVVRSTGLDELPPDIKARIPKIDESDPYSRAAAKAIYADHLPTEGLFASFYRVQALWEETMAERVVDYLNSERGGGKKMVVLTGGWHVMYGFGVPKKVLRRLPLPYTIVITEELSLPEDKIDTLTMDVDMPEIPLLKADFLWMVPYEDLEDKRLKMGILMLSRDDGGVYIEDVVSGSPAEAAGILKGDVILYFDGQKIVDSGDIRILIGEQKEGGKAEVKILREGEEITLEVTFFRMPKEAE